MRGPHAGPGRWARGSSTPSRCCQAKPPGGCLVPGLVSSSRHRAAVLAPGSARDLVQPENPCGRPSWGRSGSPACRASLAPALPSQETPELHPHPPPPKLGSWLGGGVVGQRLHTEASSDSDRGLCCGHKTDENACSHGPSVGVSPKFVCSNLIPGVMVVGGGTLGRCTGHEGRASGMGTVPSQERPRELPRPFHGVRTWPGRGPPGTRTPAGTAHRAPVPAAPSHLASGDRPGVDGNCVWRRGEGGG